MQWANNMLQGMVGAGPAAEPQPREAVPAQAPARQRTAAGVQPLRRAPLAHGEVVVSAGSVLDFGGGTDWPPARIAIVNAANCGGLGGGGVDGAITSAGGPELAADRRALPLLPGTRNDRIRTGGAVLTGPGNYGRLHGANVIHAVGPNYIMLRGLSLSLEDGDAQLREAYRETMRAAASAGIAYLGFSLLSAGIFRGPRSLAHVLQLGLEAVRECAYPGLVEVHLIAFQRDEQAALLQLLEPPPPPAPRPASAAAVAAVDVSVEAAVDASIEVAAAPEPAAVTAAVAASPGGGGTALQRASALKEEGNAAFKGERYDAAIGRYKAALQVLAAEAGAKAFGAGASVLVRPAATGGDAVRKRQRNGGLQYAMVMCDDAAAATVDVEYLPLALADGGDGVGDGGGEEEEDDVAVSRCEPLYDSESGAAALQLSLHMNWARCLKSLKRPHDGAKRANIAVALAEADRARTVAANNDRIAGTSPVAVQSASLVKAIYLRAQCFVAHKEWKRAEADLVLALGLDGENAAVSKLLKQLPKLKDRQLRENKKLSKEMSKWLAKESDAVEAGLGEVAGQSAMDMAIADAAGDPSRHVRHVGPMPAVRED